MTMTDESKNHSRALTDNEMDQLLSAFYRLEVPQALNGLPSTWPELQGAQKERQKPVAVIVAAAASDKPAVPPVSRGIAVAVATLAACMMLMVFSNVPSGPKPSATVNTTAPPVAEPDDQLMNVSAGGTDGALDENQTSLEEIDQIDLSPADDGPKTKPAAAE